MGAAPKRREIPPIAVMRAWAVGASRSHWSASAQRTSRRPPSGDQASERNVPVVVALERAARAVVAVAGGLHDEAAGGEEEVDSEAGNPRPRVGAWEAVVVAEGEHELFEL